MDRAGYHETIETSDDASQVALSFGGGGFTRDPATERCRAIARALRADEELRELSPFECDFRSMARKRISDTNMRRYVTPARVQVA